MVCGDKILKLKRNLWKIKIIGSRDHRQRIIELEIVPNYIPCWIAARLVRRSISYLWKPIWNTYWKWNKGIVCLIKAIENQHDVWALAEWEFSPIKRVIGKKFDKLTQEGIKKWKCYSNLRVKKC